jgi:hypothetical protein
MAPTQVRGETAIEGQRTPNKPSSHHQRDLVTAQAVARKRSPGTKERCILPEPTGLHPDDLPLAPTQVRGETVIEGQRTPNKPSSHHQRDLVTAQAEARRRSQPGTKER